MTRHHNFESADGHAVRDAAGICAMHCQRLSHLLDAGTHILASPALHSLWPLSRRHCLCCACQSVFKNPNWCLQEIDELCEDWQPEPLFSQLTEAQKAYEPPVVSRCSPGVTSPACMSIALHAVLKAGSVAA